MKQPQLQRYGLTLLVQALLLLTAKRVDSLENSTAIITTTTAASSSTSSVYDTAYTARTTTTIANAFTTATAPSPPLSDDVEPHRQEDSEPGAGDEGATNIDAAARTSSSSSADDISDDPDDFIQDYDDVIAYDGVDEDTSSYIEEEHFFLDTEHGGSGDDSEFDSASTNQQHHQQCSITIPLPSVVQCEQQHNNKAQEDKMYQLYSEVVEAKGGIEMIRVNIEATRDEIIAEHAQYPTAQQIKEAIFTAKQLKLESFNSNERINQLYLQLMHELVNKRDNQLDFEKLNSKILEQQIQHSQLRASLTTVESQVRQLVDTNVKQAAKLRAMESEETMMKEKIKSLEELFAAAAAAADLAATANHDYQQIEEDLSIDEEPDEEPEGDYSSLRIIENERRDTNERPAPPLLTSPQNSRARHQSRVAVKGSFKDCTDVGRHGHTQSEIYRLRVNGLRRTVKVWCDFDLDPGGWIIVQRHTVGNMDFNRRMDMYKKGFGRLKGDYWLGLENMHKITSDSEIGYKLHIEMEDWDGNRRFAEYESFKVESELYGYQLKIAHYSGNAGDSMTRNNQMRFTAKDSDHDRHAMNCAVEKRSGWWHNACGDSNLNGHYYSSEYYTSTNRDGMFWSSWHGDNYSLRRVTMMIRPNE